MARTGESGCDSEQLADRCLRRRATRESKQDSEVERWVYSRRIYTFQHTSGFRVSPETSHLHRPASVSTKRDLSKAMLLGRSRFKRRRGSLRAFPFLLLEHSVDGILRIFVYETIMIQPGNQLVVWTVYRRRAGTASFNYIRGQAP